MVWIERGRSDAHKYSTRQSRITSSKDAPFSHAPPTWGLRVYSLVFGIRLFRVIDLSQARVLQSTHLESRNSITYTLGMEDRSARRRRSSALTPPNGGFR